MEIIKKNWSLVLFTVLSLFFSLWYVEYIAVSGGLSYVKSRTILGEFGKSLGTLGGFALAVVYARSILKIIVREDSFWKRLEPINVEFFDIKKFSVKMLVILNKTHSYFGVLAIILIFLHCYLTGSYLDNLLLQIVLVLMAFEGVSGFIMEFKYSPNELKKKSYLIHRQFVVGAVLIVLTLFGHLILGD